MRHIFRQIAVAVTTCFAAMILRGDKIKGFGTISSATSFTKPVTAYWNDIIDGRTVDSGAVGYVYDVEVPAKSKAVIKTTIHPGSGTCNLVGGIGYAFVRNQRYSLGTKLTVKHEYPNPKNFADTFSVESNTPMGGSGFAFGVVCTGQQLYQGAYCKSAAVQDSFKVEVTYEKIYADLVPSIISINGEKFSNQEIVVPENQPFALCYTIENKGELGCDDSQAKLYLDDKEVAECAVGALGAGKANGGEKYEVVSGFSGEGPHTFKLVVDANGDVSESDESNNQLIARVATPYLTLSPATDTVVAQGETKTSQIATTGRWIVVPPAVDWLHVTTGSGATGANLLYRVDRNPSPAARDTTVTVTNTYGKVKSLLVRQEGMTAPAEPSSMVRQRAFSSCIDIDLGESARSLGYIIYRSESASSGFVEVGRAETGVWRDQATLPEHTYYYKIVATNEVGSTTIGGIACTTTSLSYGTYCVIDVSGGPQAAKYPVSYLDRAPAGGWTDDYKTDKIVLRRIDPGRLTYKCFWEAGLSKPFYVGVFEVTQRQWERVNGSYLGYFTNDVYRAKRPVESVSYEQIRGKARWPSDKTVAADTFMGILRAKSGLSLDMPTFTQAYYLDSTLCYNIRSHGVFDSGRVKSGAVPDFGRTPDNSGGWTVATGNSDGLNGTSEVGSYAPNCWGVYDLYGNVSEWCLDWKPVNGAYSNTYFRATDSLGAALGTAVVTQERMVVDYSYATKPMTTPIPMSSDPPSRIDSDMGFRICLTGDSQIQPCRLTFDALGGEIGYVYQTVERNGVPISLPVPVKPGNKFDGWFTSAEGGTQIADSTPIIGDMTVYAHYTPIAIQVTYDGNGGNAACSSQLKPFATHVGTLPSATRLGYRFAGWFTARCGGERIVPATILYDGITVYAHWLKGEDVRPDRYCVIDLSSGPDSTEYPVSYMSDIPSSGWTDEYKMSKMVLKRIDPATFSVGSFSAAKYLYTNNTLTAGYYIGVFPVTQRQWELIMGTRPSYFSNQDCYAMRPVDSVSYLNCRGNKWPATSVPTSSSVLGKLRERTGLACDLPTMMQYRYACRAGVTTSWNNTGYNQSSSLIGYALGPYLSQGLVSEHLYEASADFTGGPPVVGRYEPNAWGLYDMCGGVEQWLRDRYKGLVSNTVDYTGPYSSTSGFTDYYCTSSGNWCSSGYDNSDWQGHFYYTSKNPGIVYQGFGFRVAFLASEDMERTKLIFDATDGNCAVISQLIEKGGRPAALPIAYRDGYEFLGWFTDPQNGTQITEATSIADPLTVYAHWNKSERTVLFDAGEGRSFETSRVVHVGEWLGAMPLALRKGFVLTGWFTQAEGGIRACPETKILDNCTLHAQWRDEGNSPVVADEKSERCGPDGWCLTGDILRSGCIGHGRSSRIVRVVDGSAEVSFEWKTSCEEGRDYLRVFVDDNEQRSLSGITDYEAVTLKLGNGLHTIVWSYEKDDFISVGDDCGFLRNVKIVLAKKPSKPVIGSVTAVDSGLKINWNATDDTTSYNVYRNTSKTRPLTAKATGLTSTSYSDNSTTPGVDYYYWVEAVNSAGGSVSEPKSGYRAIVLTLDSVSKNFAAGGGSASVGVTANTTWKASAEGTWINLRTATGSGNGTISFSASANAGATALSGAVKVTAGGNTSHPVTKTVSVIQSCARYGLVYDYSGGAASATPTTIAGPDEVIALAAPSRDGYVFAGWTVSSGLNPSTALWGGTPTPNTPITNASTRCANGASGAVYFKGLSATAGATVALVANWTKLEDRKYLVIDLSGGPNASSYSISYLDTLPSGGWTTEYKTTKLVLRRFDAGTFMMGSPTSEIGRSGAREALHEVTLSKPCYMGVFEVTQRQWELVMGVNPSYFTNVTCSATRPVDSVSFCMIRGNVQGLEWPKSSAVDEDSFMGRLRRKTALTALDLPTEAEWEYACRAGTATAFNNGVDILNSDHDMSADESAAYYYNRNATPSDWWSCSGDCDTESGTSEVAAYLANAWGLFGMNGNVFEWCVDRFVEQIGSEAVTDPKGSETVETHGVRSGAWMVSSGGVRSAARSHSLTGTGLPQHGLRVCMRDYAHLRMPTTVTFNPNGGLCAVSRQRIEKGSHVNALPVATMPGHCFAGWFTDASGGFPVTEATVAFNADVTLWAHWKAATCKVTFSAADANMFDESVYSFTKDGTVPAFPLVEKSGCLFDGWYSANVLGSRVTSSTPISGNRTLYARWRRTAETPNSLYCVIDLSNGPKAESYPVTFLDEKPSEGWTDEYKTTKIVLRRINAGVHGCGGYKNIRLTRPYYIGVFELTKRQWELVMGDVPNVPATSTDYAVRPVENVSYQEIRGADFGTNIYHRGTCTCDGVLSTWFSVPVDAKSFISILRDKTGLRLDLPTEMQWEFACRAGTTTDYNDGQENQSAEKELRLPLLGRYNDNPGTGGTSGFTAKVGSYRPNAWELYDMHGNVMEWGLDRPASWQSDCDDPFGYVSLASAELRHLRGGSYSAAASWCTSGFRNNFYLNVGSLDWGFRLCATMTEIQAPVTVAYDVCGGSCSVSEQRFERGAALKGLPVATRKGYAFSGWFTRPGGGSIVTDEMVASSDMTLYAHWGRPGQYMVIDLSGGAKASRYPVSYLDDVPAEGWTSDYKTDKLVLRRVLPGKYIFGSPSSELGRTADEIQRWVTIAKPFYIGVFEVTQGQWVKVMGVNPSRFSGYVNSLQRPVECISYANIRGPSKGADWPLSSSVDDDSFIGRLRTKTGQSGIDLPTEAEWEYACRAGTTSALNSGCDLTNRVADANLAALGRYKSNLGQVPTDMFFKLTGMTAIKWVYGTASAGAGLPNKWGLYDMHGNVKELCIDWYGTIPSNSPVENPFGALIGEGRCLRGGGCSDEACDCRSAFRHSWIDPSCSAYDVGFRIALREGESETDVASVVKRTDGGNDVYVVALGGSGDESATVVIPASWFSSQGVNIASGVTTDLLKANGANGIPRYKSYALGLAAESAIPAEEQLKVVIDGFAADGTPVIKYSPEGIAARTVYSIFGKASISDQEWQKVNDANKDKMHFFKIRAEVR